MINVTGAFLNKLSNDERDYLEKIDMTLADGTILHLTNEDIWSGSLTFDDAVGSDNSFTALGSAIVNSLTFSINNIYDEYSAYDFTEAVAHVYIGLDINGTPEYIKKGVFTVNETTYNGQIITLKMYDNMYKFDMAYTQSGLEYPASLDTIVRNACDVCGVSLASSSLNFPRKEFVVQNRPSEKATTFREVISWCATIAGCFARCNVNGYLELKWFDVEQFNAVDDVDGGMFDTQSQSRYMTGDAADGGSFNPWSTGDVLNGSDFNFTNIHNIASLYSQNVSVDDVVITQISAEVKVESEDSTSGILVFTSGTEGYGISIKGNDFLTEDNAQNVVSYLGQQIIGTRFRKASVQHSSNPTIEAGDCAYVFDTKGNRYDILVTRTNFKVGGAQTTVCGADTPMRNSASRFSESTKSYVELRERLANQRNTFDQKQEELAERIENAQGLYFTEVPQQTGGSKYYLHDKQTLGESDIQILVSDVGITVTPDGGDTWYGLTVDGQLIASILTAIGVNADWINTGQLVVRKGQTEVLFVDVDTGTVRIKADSFSLTSGETIQSIADDAASSAVVTSNNYTDTQIAATNQALSTFSQQVTADIEDLQAQIDGQIETWYYDYAPTLSNAPASDWTTETLKEEHQGDVFIDTSTGRSYRFLKNDNVWQWKIIEDTDMALALQTARDALDLADHKRRVFVSQPTPPYDVGDLWVQGSNGDILRCQTGKSTSGSYSASDWILASKYTDDSALHTFLNGDYASDINNIQGQIDQKIETWYQNADPSASWNAADKINHTGDIWFCTATTGTYAQKTWQYNGSAWSEMKTTPPKAVMDTLDGKAQIFVSQPTTPYSVGDLWFDSATSDIMTCVTARATGNYTASDWQKRNKYTDDTAVDNLSIGGRNLLLLAGNQTISTNYLVRRFDLSPIGKELKANDDVTFSFKARIASDRLKWAIYNSGGVVKISEWQAITPDGQTDVIYKWSGKWKRASTESSNTYINLYFGTAQTTSTENIIYWAKLEKGNKATDFTAAPEDIESELTTLGDSLQSQIDNKIQTWTQATNPASAWSTATQRESHNGDLWYYTGETNTTYTNNTTYKYNASSNTWTSYAVSPDLFDAIDGKVNIFYGSPNTTYEDQKVGDYLVDPTDGCSYRRTSNAWVKVSDYASAIDSALDTFVDSVYNPKIQSIEQTIDGKIDTYFYAYAPTLSNIPASAWNTTQLKDSHLDDIFYDTSTGYAYRFTKSGSTYSWTRIKDSDITSAMTAASNAKDVADGKRRVFVAQPVPPYDIGDLWTQGSSGDIMKCKTARASGSYNASDWEKASKYTDDSGLTNWINGDFATTISQVQGQIDRKSETWYQSADPSANWTTTAIKNEHKGDLWYCTSSTGTYAMKYWRWSGSAWKEMKATPPTSVFNQIDGKAQIFISQPTPPYRVGDLWFNSTTSDIMTCVTKRDSGSYVASDWQKRNKYTDDTTVKAQYGTCTTAASTANKVVSLANFSLYTGARISVYFTYANSATSPTLNVNGTGAKSIYAYGSTLAANSPYNWAAKSTVEFVYNGNQWVMSDSGANAKVQALDQSLTQTAIFNKLTNNGAAQGIFMRNGQLYINMTYLQTGTLKLGGANNADGILEVYNARGTKIGKWDKDGADISGNLVVKDNEGTLEAKAAKLDVIYIGNVEGKVWNARTPGFATFPVTQESNLNMFGVGMTPNRFFHQKEINTSGLYSNTGNMVTNHRSDDMYTVKQGNVYYLHEFYHGQEFAYQLNTITMSSDIPNDGTHVKWTSNVVGPVLAIGVDGIGRGTPIVGTGSYEYARVLENAAFSISAGTFVFKKDSYLFVISGSGSANGKGHRMLYTSSGLEVNGSYVALQSSSSSKYKHNIKSLSDEELDPHRLYKLPIKQFRYNVDVFLQYKDMYGMTLPGFIAEDVAEIYPSAVIHHPEHTDDVESWDERRIIPPMLSLIQEQHEQIESLTARIEQLESLIHTK